MADSVGSRHGTSDEYHDPFCEPCEESRGRNVKIECFCKNCNQYLCIECHTTHGSLKATRGHVIQTGDEMPKSMADKPPRYDSCDDHPKYLKDQFCCDHGTLVCSTCCSTSHAMCNTKSIADTCQYFQQSGIDTLCDVNKTYKSQLLKFLSSMDKHGEKLKEQKKTMLKDALTTYDKILAEIKRSLQNIKAVIKAECGSQAEAISQAKQEINAQMTRADTEINFTYKLRGKPITVKSFLSLQESVSNTRESVAAIESLKDSLSLTSFSFEPSKDVQKLVSQTISFGSLNKHAINVGFDVTLPDIKFPISLKTSAAGTVGRTKQQGHTGPGAPQVAGTVGRTKQQGHTGSGAQQAAGTVGSTQQHGNTGPGAQQVVGTVGSTQQQGHTGSGAQQVVGTVGSTQQQGHTGPGAQQVKATQQASIGQTKDTQIGTFNVKIYEDDTVCWINGITITPSGQRLVVDSYNGKVKLFSPDMRFLSSVSVPERPWDITMVNDREAVVTVGQSLVFLEVTDTQLRNKHKIEMSFNCYGITHSNGKLFVTDSTTIHALDLQGTELWSVGRSLFKSLFQYAWYVRYVSSNSDGRWIVVTDCDKKTITILDTNNGAVITSRQPKNCYRLGGVSVDMSDNIFVCAGSNIVVLSSDLKNEHVLFNMGDAVPQTIAYDKTKHQLVISKGYNEDTMSCIQLS